MELASYSLLRYKHFSNFVLMLLKKKTLNYELPSQIKAVTQVSFIETTEYHLFITQKFAAKILP